jgi:glycosyltransferase involved in cell wall biosynthesis
VKIVLNTAAATWLGGQYYLENLALALKRLGDAERPDVLVNGAATLPAGTAEVVDGVPADATVVFPNWGLGDTGSVAQMHWIPDLQHRALPENFSRLGRLRRDIGYQRLIRRARAVIVSSNAVADAVRSAYPRSRPKLRVLHFRTVVTDDVTATDPRDVVERSDLPDRFVLLPNQFWSHKNHATAFGALDQLELPIVCTGEPTDYRRPHYAEALLEEVHRAGYGDRVRVLGVVPRSDYLQLVRAASVVLQPSLFEGWSSIVEDARAFGKPIALSDIDVHREQDPERGFFFSPRDAQALAKAVNAAAEQGSAPEEDALRAQDERVREYAASFMRIAREASAAV